MGKGLLVIDMQNVCVGSNHSNYFKYNRKSLIAFVNERIEKYEGNNVIYIKNIMKNNFVNRFAPFKAFDGTTEVDIADEVKVVSDNIFKKFKGDAFSNENLDKFLKENNINELELVGVDGGGCVAKTALGAIKQGYKVILNTNAIGTMFNKKEHDYREQLKELGAKII